MAEDISHIQSAIALAPENTASDEALDAEMRKTMDLLKQRPQIARVYGTGEQEIVFLQHPVSIIDHNVYTPPELIDDYGGDLSLGRVPMDATYKVYPFFTPSGIRALAFLGKISPVEQDAHITEDDRFILEGHVRRAELKQEDLSYALEHDNDEVSLDEFPEGEYASLDEYYKKVYQYFWETWKIDEPREAVIGPERKLSLQLAKVALLDITDQRFIVEAVQANITEANQAGNQIAMAKAVQGILAESAATD